MEALVLKSFAHGRLTKKKKRLGVRAAAADLERAEVLVPIPSGASGWRRRVAIAIAFL
jgi:hypothetical protein